MKKITTLFAMLLLCAVTAMAQTTTVTLTYTAEPFKKDATQGTMPSGYGSFSGQTYTTDAASGLAGLTVTASSGLTIGEARVNVDYYGDCFSFKTAAAATDYTVTISAPEGYVIIGYYLACSANSANQPHTLTATNGTTVTISSPYQQNWSTRKFSVFGLNEQTTSFTINTANNGNTLYVPTFTVTLATAGSVVSSVNDLSNAKQYVVMCERGVLNTNDGSLGTSAKNGLSAKNFAIINHESNYFFWSVDDEKFVASDVSLAYYPRTSAMSPQFATNSSATNPLFKFLFDANRLNTNANGVSINDYNYDDGGNTFLIIENGDFNDMEKVEPRFLDLTQYREALQEAIDAPNNLPVGEGPNKYTIMSGKDALDQAVADGVAELAKDEEEQTLESLVGAYDAIQAALGNLVMTLNMPQAGFYRIKGNTSGLYLANGNSTKKNWQGQYYYNMSSETDGSTIFYYDGTKFINLVTGKCFNLFTWTWICGNDEALTNVNIVDGLSDGGYAISNDVDGNNNPIYLYDQGDQNPPYTDRGGMASITTSTNARYTNWYLEEVAQLPVTLKEADCKDGVVRWFATFAAPVAAMAVEGAEIHKVTDMGSYLQVEPANATSVPAGTAVLLVTENDPGDVPAMVFLGEANDEIETALLPLYACEQGKAGLFFGKNDAGTVGFFPLAEEGLTGGFKGYVADDGNGAKELVFGNDATGVETIDNGQWTIDNSAVYNLQGQRVNKAQKGVYIQNGKKVVLK